MGINDELALLDLVCLFVMRIGLLTKYESHTNMFKLNWQHSPNPHFQLTTQANGHEEGKPWDI